MDDNRIEIVARLDTSRAAVVKIEADLSKITDQLNKDQALRIIANVDLGKTTQRINSQLATISKNLNLNIPKIELGMADGGGTALINNVSHIVDNVEDKIEELRKNLAEKFGVSIDKIVTNTIKNAKGQINSFSFDLTKLSGEVEKFSYKVSRAKQKNKESGEDYTVTSVKAIGSRDSDKGAIQLLERATKAANTLERQMINLKAAADDVSAPRPITSQESIDKVAQAYKNVETAVGNLRTANASTFEELNNEAKKAVDELNNVIKAQRNADTAATKLRAKPIEVVKADELSNLDKFVATISNSAIPDVSNLTRRIEELRSELSEVNDKQGLVDYLNKFANVESDFKALVAQAKAVKGALRDLDNLSNNALFQKNKSNPQVSSTLSDIENIRKEYGQLFAEIGNAKTPEDLQKISNKLAELKPQFDKVVNSANQFKTALKVENIDEGLANRIKRLTADINSYAVANKRAVESTKQMTSGRSFADEWSRITSVMAKGVDLTDGELKNLSADMAVFRKEAQAAGLAGASAFEKFGNTFKLISTYISANQIINMVTRHIREAVTELQNIDNVLTEISKTSNRTEESLRRLGESSFEVASKYGRMASDYLLGVQEMSRAGFGEEQSENLAELSILAQAAGDMTAEMANQYIIATNAAYGLEGNVEKLNRVLDSQNYITNRNALNMENLSEATKIAASQAASSGVAIDELTAAVGTMVATTQQGGEIAGRALKGILMNIQQVKADAADIGDGGEAITTESLSKYEAATKALGVSLKEVKNGVWALRDPMQVLKELSVAVRKESEDSIKVANLVSAVGGKYRGNQLIALLENWETYEKMLSEFNSEEAIGSAMQEAEKSANNWNGSINQLKNSWTQLVNQIVKSDDAVTVIQALNKEIQGVSNSETIKGLRTVFSLVVDLVDELSKLKDYSPELPILGNLIERGFDQTRGIGFLKDLGRFSNWLNEDADVAEEETKKREELRQETLKNVESYKTESNELSTLISQYVKSSSSVEDASNVKEKLSNLQSQIVSKYGEEATGIDLVNKSLEENIRLLTERQEKESRQWLKENKEGISLAEDFFNPSTGIHRSVLFGDDDFLSAEAQREAKNYIGLISKYLKEYYPDLEDVISLSDDNGFSVSATATIENQTKAVDALVKSYEYAFKVREGIFTEFDSDAMLEGMYEWQRKFHDNLDILEDYREKSSEIADWDALKSNSGTYQRYFDLIKEAGELNEEINNSEATIADRYSAFIQLDEVKQSLSEIANDYPVLSDVIKQSLSELGLSFSEATTTVESVKETWLKSLDETQKGVISDIDKIIASMQKLASGDAIDDKSAWEIINLDDNKLLSNIRIDENGEYIFDLEQIVKLKDEIINKEIEQREVSIETARASRDAVQENLEIEKKRFDAVSESLAKAKSPNARAYDVKALESEYNSLQSSIERNSNAVDAYNYSIKNESLLVETLRRKLGDLSDTNEMVEAKAKALEKSIASLKNSMSSLKNEVSNLSKEADARLQAQEHVIDGYIKKEQQELDILEKESDELNKQLDTLEEQKSKTEEMLSNYKTVADVVSSTIDKQIEGIEKERQEIEGFYDKQIEELKSANEEREDALEYEKKLANLANAQNNKVRVYDQARGWIYEADKEALQNAQEDLASFETNQQIKALEKERDKAVEGYDERKKSLEEYGNLWSDFVSGVTDEQNELLANEILGSDWREKISDKDLSVLNKFKTGYTQYNTQLKNIVDVEIANLKKSIEAKDKDVAAKKDQIQAWQDYKSAIQDTANSIKDGLEEYNKYLDTVQLNEKATNEQRLANLNKFASRYREIVDSIADKNALIESTDASISHLSETAANVSGLSTSTSALGGISGIASIADVGSIIEEVLGAMSKIFGSIFHFAKGGAADYTGLAWVDGTKTSSETVFTAAQSKKLLNLVEALPNLNFSLFNDNALRNGIANNTNSNISIGSMTVVANNPQQFAEQFNREINRYWKTKLTENKVY